MLSVANPGHVISVIINKCSHGLITTSVHTVFRDGLNFHLTFFSWHENKSLFVIQSIQNHTQLMNDGYGYIKYNPARERDDCQPRLCVWPRSHLLPPTVFCFN